MRILFLTPQLPYPPHQGTALRNLGLIRSLAARHQVSLLSFSEPGGPGRTEDPGPLRDLCKRVETVPLPPPRSPMKRAFNTLTHPLPDMALRLASPVFAARLGAWLGRAPFDVIHVEGIEMTPYLDQIAGLADGRLDIERPVVVFDDHNCEYMLQKRYAQVDARIPRRWPGALYSLVQWQKLRRYEGRVCRRTQHVLAVSATDAESLQRLVPGLEVTVIPNGIDMDSYRPAAGDGLTDGGKTRPPTLVFVGKMDFRPNVDAVRWFARAIWPRIRAQVPEARFVAVGQRPSPHLDALRGDTSITLTGWVDDLQPYITNATVYVVPLRMGSGTRLKLLEAMAFGKAIVSTHIGAEGLTGGRPAPAVPASQVQHDRELVLVADHDPAGFADATVALLRDAERRARLGTAARAFVHAHYDWRVIIPRLEALYARHW